MVFLKEAFLLSFLCFPRDSQNRDQLRGASHPESLPAEVHERLRAHFLRGVLQGTVRAAPLRQRPGSTGTHWLSFAPPGRFAGRPGNYVYVFNDYRMEEVCAGRGCGQVTRWLWSGDLLAVTNGRASLPVCTGRLPHRAVHPAQHHHVGKTADPEQHLRDRNPVRLTSFDWIRQTRAGSKVNPLLHHSA